MKAGIIVIDAQRDFCEGGTLAVTGGNAAMTRVAKFIQKHQDKLTSIDLTLDAHHRHHIAHSIMWVDSKGNNPPTIPDKIPPTVITEADITGSNPLWRASNGAIPTWIPKPNVINPQSVSDLMTFDEVQKLYISELTKSGRYPHTIWPEHCIIGTPGMCIQDDVMKAVHDWESYKGRPANKTTKGSFLFSEHFSVFKAEVQFEVEIGTKPNKNLIDRLSKLDVLLWAGLAEDFCLANSFRDFIEELSGGDESIKTEIAKKMVFLEDGTAPVGIPAYIQSFRDYLKKYNVEISTTDKFFK